MVSRRIAPLALCTLLLCSAHLPVHADAFPEWLTRVNLYRATAGLPPAREDEALSRSVWQHARYMVRHDVIKHFEKPGDDWATPEGAAAAAASDLAGSSRVSETDSWAIDTWMQAPFHAVGILDPALRNVGFGLFSHPGGAIQTAAGLDVLRGRAPASTGVTYPVVWPADGASVPIVAHTSEYPSPLSGCKGYSAPSGLPLIVQLGAGETVPHVTGSALFVGNQPLEHCVFDQTNYRNRQQTDQSLGRSILAARNAVVIVPRRPLIPGQTYRARLNTNGRVIDWTFKISAPYSEPVSPSISR